MLPRRYSLTRNDGRIWIEGQIAPDQINVAALRRSLRESEAGQPVRVVMNTSGGHCDEGMAMYLALRECGRPVEMTVRRAASMGAVIAMAGDRILIEERGWFFLHPPGFSREQVAEFAPHMTAELFRHAARRLDHTEGVTLDILTRRTGLDRTKVAALCTEDTTLDAQRAVELGFADEIIPQEHAHG